MKHVGRFRGELFNDNSGCALEVKVGDFWASIAYNLKIDDLHDLIYLAQTIIRENDQRPDYRKST